MVLRVLDRSMIDTRLRRTLAEKKMANKKMAGIRMMTSIPSIINYIWLSDTFHPQDADIYDSKHESK